MELLVLNKDSMILVCPVDCPRVFLFRYMWYWSEYFFRVFCMIRFNIFNIRFGNLIDSIRKIYIIVFHTPKLIKFDYNLTFKNIFDNYDDYCNIKSF